MRDIDLYYDQKEEPVKSCLMTLRKYILDFDERLTEAWKYRMPFFCFKGKMFCYLWIDKKTQNPYIGMADGGLIDHPELVQGSRSRMKILNINPTADIPVNTIREVLTQAIEISISKTQNNK